MIEKKEGIINDIIFRKTVYDNHQYRYFPCLIGLEHIINQICDSNATTEYIRITPFYRNAKINGQLELEDHMFYIECRDSEITEDNILEHIAACFGVSNGSLTKEQIRIGKLQYPLCSFDDIKGFADSLKNYQRYLYDELIPKLFDNIRKEYKSIEDNLAFGYFAFEIHSG